MRAARRRQALALLAGVLPALLAVFGAVAEAQDLMVEVRTWTGQSWRLAQASLDASYSLVVKPEEAAAAAAGPRQEMSFRVGTIEMAGDKKLETRQALRPVAAVRLVREGLEIQVPVARLAGLSFFRTLVSPDLLLLPPYIQPTHFRYSATALLTDGSSVPSDYVNLGATVLRGVTREGRVEIPWQDIEVLLVVR